MVEIARIPKDITKYYIPDSILNNTVSHLRKVGDGCKEGIAYWSGVLDKNEAHITRAIFADNYPEFQNEERFARVSLDAALKIGRKYTKTMKFYLRKYIHILQRRFIRLLMMNIHISQNRFCFNSRS